MLAAALLFAALAFALSATAGLGGSLLLVPGLSLLFGAKAGVALSALLLMAHNAIKLFVYRATVPWGGIARVVVAAAVGAWIGARLLLAAPEAWVAAAVVVATGSAFLTEHTGTARGRGTAMVFALLSGALSGFSGTSGPLKGLALRSVTADRLHFVGAAAVVSLAGDATKTAVFASAALVGPEGATLLALALPLMPLAALLGRSVNRSMGERAFALLFWGLMTAYSIRVLLP